MPGEAVRRGPSESNSTCARRCSSELSVSIAQMRRSTGSSTAKPVGCGNCAVALVVTAAMRNAADTATRTAQLPGEGGVRSLYRRGAGEKDEYMHRAM